MKIAQSNRSLAAIAGGSPVRSSLLPYGRQSISEDDIRDVVDVLRSDWLTTGPKVSEFEEAVAARVQAVYAVAFSSGTAALHGAAFAANIGPGDEAITTPLTFCATANCVVYQGGRPVFADVVSDNLTVDPQRVLDSVTPRTRAILPVDYAGGTCDLGAIMEIAERHGLVVIEDACHALGATYRSKPVGTIAHMTVFSFHPVKHVTTGEGGMVCTNNADFARRLRMFRNHGINSEARERHNAGEWRYDMVYLGYNYRLSDIACALGISQLRRLDENLRRRRSVAEQYRRAFARIDGIRLLQPIQLNECAWHLFPIRFEAQKFRANRNEIFRALRAENIGVNVHYVPVHLHDFYRRSFGTKAGDYPVAEAAYEELISLPMFHAMTEQDVADVIYAVGKVAAHYAA